MKKINKHFAVIVFFLFYIIHLTPCVFALNSEDNLGLQTTIEKTTNQYEESMSDSETSISEDEELPPPPDPPTTVIIDDTTIEESTNDELNTIEESSIEGQTTIEETFEESIVSPAPNNSSTNQQVYSNRDKPQVTNHPYFKVRRLLNLIQYRNEIKGYIQDYFLPSFPFPKYLILHLEVVLRYFIMNIIF